MKLARRRPDPTAAPQDVEAAPTAPRGAPVAAFAGILDGRRLWLAIDPRPGSLALRDTQTGDVIAPSSDLDEDDLEWRSTRLDLDGLPGDAEATYDVVLVPTGGRAPRAVWTPALPPARTPPAPDGVTRYVLARADDGTLQVHRRPVPAAAEVRALTVTGDGVRLTVAGVGDTVTLVGDDGPLATYPTTADGDLLTATISPAALPPGTDAQCRVLLTDGTSTSGLPVRRRDDGLLDPGRGAPLPEIETVAGPVLQLRWSPQGLLTARIDTTGAAR